MYLLRSSALYTVQQRLAWGGGAANQVSKRQPLAAASALASAVRSLRYVVWCRGQCGVVWYGVVWCAAMVLLRRIGSGPEVHEPCASGHDALLGVRSLALLVCMSLIRPPSVRLFVSGRSFVASRKSKKFRTGEILGGMHGLT